MVSRGNIKELCEYVLNYDHRFNLDVLTNIGFDEDDIDYLKQNGFISEQEGIYVFEDIDRLFQIGKSLLENDKEAGKAYLERALQLDCYNIEAWTLLLSNNVYEKNYEEVVRLFDLMPVTEEKYHKYDYYYCLYLLGFVTDLPDTYKNFVKYLTLADMTVPTSDTRFENRVWQNRIRLLVLQRKFRTAYREQSDMMNKCEYRGVQDAIYRELLREAVKEDDKYHDKIIKLVKKKDYSGIIEAVNKREEQVGVGSYDRFTLKLVKEIKGITEHGIIPKKRASLPEDSVFEAIDAGDYEAALEKIKHYIEDNDYTEDQNTIYLLLNDICSLMAEAREKAKEIQLPEREKSEDMWYDVGYYTQKLSKEEIVAKYCDSIKTNGGIILLEPMTEEEAEEISNLVSGISRVISFTIDYGSKKRVVIRRRTKYANSFNFNEEIKLAEKLYKAKRYDQCEEKFLLLLDYFKNPDSYIFSRLGYVALGKKEVGKAIDYFEIANYFAKVTGYPHDFSPLIERLKRSSMIREKQRPIELDETSFDEDNYGIDFDQINDLVALSGKGVADACLSFGLTGEQVDTANLLYARGFFMQNSPEQGEIFLRAYEQSEYKTAKNNELFNSIIRNKALYAKKGSEGKRLLLTARPKK